MSRAFVKELDAAPELPIFDRVISDAPNRVTPRGARLIESTVASLEKQLAETNSPDASASIRRDLRYWYARLASMQVMPPLLRPDVAGFGARATIRWRSALMDVTIVGEDEANPSAGLIAWTAPLARALEGAKAGDAVELKVGGIPEQITVVGVASRRDEP